MYEYSAMRSTHAPGGSVSDPITMSGMNLSRIAADACAYAYDDAMTMVRPTTNRKAASAIALRGGEVVGGGGSEMKWARKIAERERRGDLFQ